MLWLKTTKLPPKGVIHLFQHVSRIKLFASKDLWTILAPFGSVPNGARIADTFGFPELAATNAPLMLYAWI